MAAAILAAHRTTRGRMLHASILVIGDEILAGYVQDTNSGWIAERLRVHGVPLARVHTVPDDFRAIDEALSAELSRRRPRVVITSGGIGSTPDDVTFAAVAASLGRPLVEHPELTERIGRALEWTRSQGLDVGDEFADHMMRMARIPEGGRLLAGSRGFAPGVRIEVAGGVDDEEGGGEQGATVVILPGVPSQLRTIVRDGVEPALLAGHNHRPTVVEVTHPFPESALNLCFAEVMERHPEVKLGSYPGLPMTVRLSGPEGPTRAAAEQVRRYVRDLEDDPAGARLAAAWTARFAEAGSEA